MRQAPIRIVTDYGLVGSGASSAHYVLAEDESEYIIKGPSLTPRHPYVAANELVAGELAQMLGLPVLNFRVLTMADKLFFGSTWMPKGTFYPQIDRDSFGRCDNRDVAHGIVVFDAWVRNSDRHHENLIVRVTRQSVTSAERHHLLLNDHSHCLVRPDEAADSLTSFVDEPVDGFCLLDFVREAVTDPVRLRDWIRRVMQISGSAIAEIVDSVPEPLLSSRDRAPYVSFLMARAARLASLFDAAKGSFPATRGASS